MGAVLQDEMGQLDGRQREGIMLDKFISYARLESALLGYPGVMEAGVLAVCHFRQQPLLKVFLALDGNGSSTGESSDEAQETNFSELKLMEFTRDVQDFLRQTFDLGLTNIKVIIRDKLPMTRSGKILRNVLSEWE